ncbi:hypothetical protein [Prescottella agglutinans]|uniref:Small-conductance mechanosensitive channel n=1 Tax=Prescottella agglutinans TaxID=1644129 RepID=A0ABT6MFM8_9NOCA|nr:hypothetical protein [Prescottella agglutinans]MDH6283128.1 small-conductance mechanosensitive channel [Prescottella agglutinans]
MSFADSNPGLPLAIRRANEIAREQHAARMEAVQRRAEAERDTQAGQASNDAAFEEYLAENRRRKASPWADIPDELLTSTQTIDKMRSQARADRETARDNKFAEQDAAIGAMVEQHQAYAQASHELKQQAYEERIEQLGEVAAERDRRAEATATIDEMRRQRRNRI